MDYRSLHMKTVVELKKLAKDLGVRVPSGMKKEALIETLLEREHTEAKQDAATKPVAPEKAPIAAKPSEAMLEIAAPETKPADAPVKPAAPRKRVRPSKPASAPEKEPAETAAVPEKAAQDTPAKSTAAHRTPVQPTVAPSSAKPVQTSSVKDPAKPVAVSAKPAQPVAVPSSAKPAAVSRNDLASRQRNTGNTQTDGSAQRPGTPQQPAVSSAPDRRRNAVASQTRPATPVRSTANASQPRPTINARQSANAAEQNANVIQPRPTINVPQNANTVQPTAINKQPTADRAHSAEDVRRDAVDASPAAQDLLAAGDCSDGAGVLEIQPDGYGFLRAENCLPGPNDVYISIAQIRRFNLRMGDYVEGKTRPQREGDRYSALVYINAVNGHPPAWALNRPRFEDLVPIYPDKRIRLEPKEPRGRAGLPLRLVDMFAPIGRGQRGMIVSQPKAGKTTLLKQIANAITDNCPDIELIVLLIDERPEEVTDMKRSIRGEVVYSTFDEEPEHHVRVSEMVLERAQRLVEMGRDVVVLMDSITRLARAYNLVIAPTGRSLSGGLDPGALFKPKRFFGAARNIENGGSLTVIATALVDTGSRMDDIIYEEFKGTGNMELHLDRRLSDKRVFPAVDMVRSGTRREELLLTEDELDGELLARRVLSNGHAQEVTEQLIDLMSRTSDNAEFYAKLRGWVGVMEKGGFTLGGK